MNYFDLVSFIVLSLTGMFIMSFGSLFTWLLSSFMGAPRWVLIVPIAIGMLIVATSITFFWRH